MLPTNPTSLQALLNTGLSWRPVNLLTFTLQSGTVLRITDHDVDLTVGGQLFTHNAPLFKRGDITRRCGVEVDTLRIDVMPGPADLIGTTPWLVALQAGALDFAGVTLDIGVVALENGGAYDSWNPVNLLGTIPGYFVGKVGTVGDVGTQHAALMCQSFTSRLDVQMPRNLIQPGCLNTLFTPPCGLVESAWRTTGSIGAVAGDQVSFSSADIVQASGYFDAGRLTITSGNNAGVSRKIKAQVGTTLYLFAPFVWPLAAGVTFAASPGCPKTQAVCQSKFANKVNFRGLPYVPTPETVLT